MQFHADLYRAVMLYVFNRCKSLLKYTATPLELMLCMKKKYKIYVLCDPALNYHVTESMSLLPVENLELLMPRNSSK